MPRLARHQPLNCATALDKSEQGHILLHRRIKPKKLIIVRPVFDDFHVAVCGAGGREMGSERQQGCKDEQPAHDGDFRVEG